MARLTWCVRIIQSNNAFQDDRLSDGWVETLVNMGVVNPIDGFDIFEFLPPAGVEDSSAWAHREAERLCRMFGVSAAAAPKWPTGVRLANPTPATDDMRTLANRGFDGKDGEGSF